MKVTATARNLKTSAQKLRLSADMVRGVRAVDALKQMAVMPQKGAIMVYDVINSAVANASHNYNLGKANLVVSEIYVGEGSRLRRFRPRARGRAGRIEHPMAHLTVILEDKAIDKAKVKSDKTKVKATKLTASEAK